MWGTHVKGAPRFVPLRWAGMKKWQDFCWELDRSLTGPLEPIPSVWYQRMSASQSIVAGSKKFFCAIFSCEIKSVVF